MVKENKEHSLTFPLAARKKEEKTTVVKIGDTSVGGGQWTVIAGPCSVESFEQAETIVEQLTGMGIKIIRGGLFKPRKSPYDFQGLREQGIGIIKELKKRFSFNFVTEILSPEHLEILDPVVDVWQVGARSMANYELLKILSRTSKPVLLKRGVMATIEEWLLAAEYILEGGNKDVILCERGIRSFEPMTRFTFDINAIPVVKELSHLPVIADPSHAVGRRKWVPPLAKAALVSGADGIMVEVHPDPPRALSDAEQSIYPRDFEALLKEIAELRSCTFPES